MNGAATLEIRLAPTRVAAHQRGPVQIGQLLPTLLERYGVDLPLVPRKAPQQVKAAATWLGQQTLAELAEA